VQWQRQQLDGPFSRELVAYWTTQLGGLCDFRLSGDLRCEGAASTRGGKCVFTIPEQDARRLDAMSRRCRVTLTTVLLAMFTLFLGRFSELDEVAVGVPLPDRRRPDFEPLIGLFANVVIVRTAIVPGITFVELLQRVRRALFDACRFQDLPYGQLLQIVGAQAPLHRVVFNFLPDIPASSVGLAGLRVTPLPVDTEHPAVADLSLHVRRETAGLACRLVYKADLFSASWAQAFAAQFQMLITAVLDEPQKGVGAWRTH
jgi:non-ribosomal peptide synthetase component F